MTNDLTINLFYGNETYLMDNEITKIIKMKLHENDRELNVIHFDLMSVSIDDVIREATTPSFLAEHKVIVANNAWFFTGQKPTKSIDQNMDELGELLEKQVDFSTIIFKVNSEKLDERKKIVKKIKKLGRVKAFSTLSGKQLSDWVMDKAKREKVLISDGAVQLLIQTIGQNLQLLSQEIAKMSLYVEENGMINEQVVLELTTRTMEQNIFALIDKMANLAFGEALQMLYDLLKNKEEPIKIVALLARQFRIMLYAKELHRIGYSAKQIATQLGVHPYTIQLSLKQAGRFNEKQLKDILKKIAEMDQDIKTGKMDKVLSLEMFVFYLNKLVS